MALWPFCRRKAAQCLVSARSAQGRSRVLQTERNRTLSLLQWTEGQAPQRQDRFPLNSLASPASCLQGRFSPTRLTSPGAGLLGASPRLTSPGSCLQSPLLLTEQSRHVPSSAASGLLTSEPPSYVSSSAASGFGRSFSAEAKGTMEAAGSAHAVDVGTEGTTHAVDASDASTEGTTHPADASTEGTAAGSAHAVDVGTEGTTHAADASTEGGVTPTSEEQVAVVDTSGLFRSGHVHTKEEEQGLNAMEQHLLSLIRFRGGPMSLAEYMEQVLTHPLAGYYMKRDVFGTSGDFVTSPDISQMFGELVGVWAMCAWEQLGRPARFHLVELGPGRGALMADLLRSTRVFGEFSSAIAEVSLVEVSPALREAQRETLSRAADLSRHKDPVSPGPSPSSSSSPSPISSPSQSPPSSSEDKESFSFLETPVRWYKSLGEVPSGVPFILVAHEFFDALPIHQFQKTPRGWCEKLVDAADTPVVPSSKVQGPLRTEFRFVLSPGPTAATTLALRPRLAWAPKEELDRVEQVEVSPASVKTCLDIAQRVSTDKGAALIVDYGQDSLVSDSLQAIRQHQFVPALDRPGSADLSAHVDFAALKHAVNTSQVDAVAHGPITQASFLGQLGINFRLEALMANATEEQGEALQVAYWRLVGDGEPPWEEEEEEGDVEHDQTTGGKDASIGGDANEGTDGARTSSVVGMGTQYKVMAVMPKSCETPVCFTS